MNDQTGDELATSSNIEASHTAGDGHELEVSAGSQAKRMRRRTSAMLTMALAGGLLIAPPAAQGADRVESFINGVAPMAQQGQLMYGVPASVAIAQAILESGWGDSSLSKYGHAYFGVKCSATPSPYQDGCINMPTWEVFNGVSVTINAPFRTYAKVSDSFLDHGYFLRNNSRYAPAFQTTNADDFARAIHRAGYATDPAYSQKLINLINANNLRRFDNLNYQAPLASVDHGIGEHWRAMNAADKAALGNPRSAEVNGPVGNSRMVSFNSGIIAWHPVYGSHAIFGKMWDTYRLDSNIRNSLGFPTSERFAVPGGWNQNFERGRIIEDPTGYTRVLHGAPAIADPGLTSAASQPIAQWGCKAPSQAGLGGTVGHPVAVDGGVRQQVQNGDIYCTPTGEFKVLGAIVTRHRDLERSKWLGAPQGDEFSVAGGAAQHFANGAIYWTSNGSIAVRDAIWTKYHETGAHQKLGLPLAEEVQVQGGAKQTFERGDIYWTNNGAVIVRDGMRTVYGNLGGVDAVGLPLGDERPVPGGAQQSFQYAEVFWTDNGPIVIANAMLWRYRDLGGVQRVGVPLAAEQRVAGGAVQRFSNAQLYWNDAKNAVYMVSGGILANYQNTQIGLPTSDEFATAGGAAQKFQHADIYWGPSTGCHLVANGMRTGLQYHGGSNALGLPISGEEQVPGGVVQRFAKGDLYYHAASGEISRTAPKPQPAVQKATQAPERAATQAHTQAPSEQDPIAVEHGAPPPAAEPTASSTQQTTPAVSEQTLYPTASQPDSPTTPQR